IRFITLGEPGDGLIIWIKLHEPGKNQRITATIEVTVHVHTRWLIRDSQPEDLLFGEFGASRHALCLRCAVPAQCTAHRRHPGEGPHHFEKLSASYANGVQALGQERDLLVIDLHPAALSFTRSVSGLMRPAAHRQET